MVLLFALCGIKLALLTELDKHLYQIHWRLSGNPTTWLNYVAFYAFVCIGVGTLATLAQRCREIDVRAVRTANAIVVGLGLVFIFLTFHTGDKNYLYPIMVGTLKWNSLVPYLSLDLFFRPPFLSIWLLGYALVYYVMVRTGREQWALHFTTVCAGAYGLFCLRDLIALRNELLVANCLGIACLVASRAPIKRFDTGLLALPVVWALLFWALLRFGESNSDRLPTYFVTLAGLAVIVFVASILLARKDRFFGPWVSLVPFYFVAFFLLTNSNYPVARNYNNLLCLGLASPRYFLGELILVCFIILFAGAFVRLFPARKLWWLDLLGLALITIAVVDFGLTRTMGQRLEWDVLTFGNSPRMMWRMARPFLPAVLGGLVSLGLVYGLGLQIFKHRVEPRLMARTIHRPAKGVLFLVAGFVLLGATGLLISCPDKARGESAVRFVSSAPLLARATSRALTVDEFLQSAKTLGMGNFTQARTVTSTNSSEPLNVVLIFMESSYNKHLSLFGAEEETQPLLSKYKDRMEIFPNFFSNFAGSIHARFATFTSLYPGRDYNAFTLRRVPVRSIFEVLHDHHYTSSLFYSSFFDYTGFGDFLKDRNIDRMYDADTMPVEHDAERVAWGLSETETLGAIRRQIREYASKGDRFFLTYVPAAPHYPYDRIPARFCKFKKLEMDDYKPPYLNELLYMDWVITSVLDELAQSGLLDKTLVVITNDHGEMLGGKDGPIGHGWAVTPELANTPLIVMDPRKSGCRINYTIGSQIDLLPTILDRLEIPIPPDQLYQGNSLFSSGKSLGRITVLDSCGQAGFILDDCIVIEDGDSSSGNKEAMTQRVFAISNQGARTLFTPRDQAPKPSFSLVQFREFQASLLRMYAYYSSVVQTGANHSPPRVASVSK